MKRAAYISESLEGGGHCVSVTPDTQLNVLFLLALLPLQIPLLGVLVMAFGHIGVGIWCAQAVPVWLLLSRWGTWNRGRSRSFLYLGPDGMRRGQGSVLPWAVIDRVQMTAPHLGGLALGRPGCGLVPIVSAAPPGGLRAAIAERSWRVEAVSEGHTFVLAGGLTEPVARGVLHEIAKAMFSGN